jgi:thiosulfate dehydrogenase
LPGKENDWPAGGAPGDVPYDTKGKKSAHLVKPIPRLNAAGAVVTAPVSVLRNR